MVLQEMYMRKQLLKDVAGFYQHCTSNKWNST
ncbi:hypothetical protein SAMN05428952_100653 [Nitrosomonas sp. Nm132]|jgi:hypothetical protein|nr:hypothetical protein SAMN05428952_100653 [Nitrosomonas sp. Nm132]